MSRVNNEDLGWEICSVCKLPIPATNVQQFIVENAPGSVTVQFYCFDKTLCHQFIDLPIEPPHKEE